MNSFVDKLLCRNHDDASSGDEVHDADAVNLSHVGEAVHRALGQHHNRHHLSQWNVTSGKIVGSVHDTPRSVVDRAKDPGAGHDDWFPDKLGEIIGRTESWCDIMSLGPPDGKFLTAFQDALATLAERSKTTERPIVVRMLFGNIAGMPVNCDGVIKALTSNLPANDDTIKLHLWVGAWRKGLSWNHAKLVAVDGLYLHAGGHNLWDAHYLANNPVHDLSMEMEGRIARDGHRFANQQWQFVKEKQSTCAGCVVDALPDYLPLAVRTRVTVSEWPKDRVAVSPPRFTKRRAPRTQRLSRRGEPNDVPLISIGRQGSMVHRSRPSDDAILAMIHSSKTIIRLVLQDLGPVCIPGTKKALPGLVWPKEYLSALGKAIYERGVDVEMILSNPNSIPGGLKGTEANYGNGWDCVDVAAEIVKGIQKQHSDVDDARLRAMITDNLRICFVRHGKSSQYEDGKTIGLHSKHFIVDDRACYIGSQNLYMCDLAEWGIVVDHEGEVKKILNDYFAPMWENSYTGEDVNVQLVMDGLDVDRDGEKQSTGMFGKGGGKGAHHLSPDLMMPHGTGAEYYHVEKDGDDDSAGTGETDEPASPARKSRGVGRDPANETEREERAPIAGGDSSAAAARDDTESASDGRETPSSPTPRDAASSNEETASPPQTPPRAAPALSFGLESLGASIATGLGAGLESLGFVTATPTEEAVPETASEAAPAPATDPDPAPVPSNKETASHASSKIESVLDTPPESTTNVAPCAIHEKDTAASAPSEEDDTSPPVDEEMPNGPSREAPKERSPTKGGEDSVSLQKQESAIIPYEPPAEKTEERKVGDKGDEDDTETAAKEESTALDCCGIADCLNTA